MGGFEGGRTGGSYFGRVIERLRNFGKVGSEREFMNHMTQIHHYPCCISLFATSPNQSRGGRGGGGRTSMIGMFPT